MAFVLDKLLTVRGDSGEARQLRQTGSCVLNVTGVTAAIVISLHVRSAFTVVTDYCHANSILVTHVAEYCKRLQTSLAIRVDGVATVCCGRIEVFQVAARLG